MTSRLRFEPSLGVRPGTGLGLYEFIYGLCVAFGSELPSSLVFLYLGGDMLFGCGWRSFDWVSVVIVGELVWCSGLGSAVSCLYLGVIRCLGLGGGGGRLERSPDL